MRFTEFTGLAISLTSLLDAGNRHQAEKHASVNLRLSGIRDAQASAAKGQCVHEFRSDIPASREKQEGRRSAPLCVNCTRDLQPPRQNWKRIDSCASLGSPTP